MSRIVVEETLVGANQAKIVNHLLLHSRFRIVVAGDESGRAIFPEGFIVTSTTTPLTSPPAAVRP